MTRFAVVRIWPVGSGKTRSDGDNYVVAWPHDAPGHHVELLAEPFDTLAAAQAAAASSIPPTRKE
jgi:hypothetical protein